MTKITNEYAMAAGIDFYHSTPKAVWAALATSFATIGGDRLEEAHALLMEEWRILHQDGIVWQKPPKAST